MNASVSISGQDATNVVSVTVVVNGRTKTYNYTQTQYTNWLNKNPQATTTDAENNLQAYLTSQLNDPTVSVYVHVFQLNPPDAAVMICDASYTPDFNWWND